MKSYTNLEQSEKLAEILPIESADMCYPYDRHLNKMYGDIPYVMGYKRFNEDTDFPCWSLAALISLLPKRYCLETLDNGTYACYNFLSQYEKFGKTPIDAVYSMIVFLKKKKII